MKKRMLILPLLCLCLNACDSIDLSQKPENWNLEYWLFDKVDINSIDKNRLYKRHEDSYEYLDKNYTVLDSWAKYGYLLRDGEFLKFEKSVSYNLFNHNNEWMVTKVIMADPSIDCYGFLDGEKNFEKFLRKTGLKEKDGSRCLYENGHYEFGYGSVDNTFSLTYVFA